ncbi:hypothetical protein ACF0H5_017170 [Mactra antiquata]
MKGSSSARLPKLNTGYLVEKQYGNQSTNKRQKKGNKASKKIRPVPQHDDRHPNTGTGKKSMKDVPTKAMDEKVEVTVQADSKSLFKHKANARNEDTMKICKPNEEPSAISLEQRRLVSAKTREHLLSLMPTPETFAEILKNEEFLWTAKQEIDRLRKRFDKGRHLAKDDSSKQKSNCLLEQAKKAAKINKSVMGIRDRTNNCQNDYICDFVFGVGSSKYQPPEVTSSQNEIGHASNMCSGKLVDAVNDYSMDDTKQANESERIEHDFYN